jgi:hypothetical protein
MFSSFNTFSSLNSNTLTKLQNIIDNISSTPLQFTSNTLFISGNTDSLQYQNGSYSISISSTYHDTSKGFEAFIGSKSDYSSNRHVSGRSFSHPTTVLTTTTSGTTTSTVIGEWLQIQLPYTLNVTSYTLFLSDGVKMLRWSIYGSDDGTNFVILDTQEKDVSFWNNASTTVPTTFNMTTDKTFKYLRLYAPLQNNFPYIALFQLNFIGNATYS